MGMDRLFSFDHSFARSTINPLTSSFSAVADDVAASLVSRKLVGRLIAGSFAEVVVDALLLRYLEFSCKFSPHFTGKNAPVVKPS